MNNASLANQIAELKLNHLEMITECRARIEYLESALDILTCMIIRNLGDNFSLEEVQELKVAMAWLSKYQENAT
jgi:hypothetical protein